MNFIRYCYIRICLWLIYGLIPVPLFFYFVGKISSALSSFVLLFLGFIFVSFYQIYIYFWSGKTSYLFVYEKKKFKEARYQAKQEIGSSLQRIFNLEGKNIDTSISYKSPMGEEKIFSADKNHKVLEMDTTKAPPGHRAKSKYPEIVMTVGIVAILHGCLGFVISFNSIAYIPPIPPSDLVNEKSFEEESWRKVLKVLDEAQKDLELDPEKFMKNNSRKKFKFYVSALVLLVIVFYVSLTYIGYQFVRFKLKFLWPFVGLMIFYLAYFFGFTQLVILLVEFSPTFVAAWILGNLGLFPVMATFFWLWGPILAILGVNGLPSKP